MSRKKKETSPGATKSSEEGAYEDTDAEQEFLVTADNEDDEPFLKWLEQETKDGVIDFDTIPEFNVQFAELIRKTTRSSVAFTDILRTEAYIYSYEKFVDRMGGTPAAIFDIFGMTMIEQFQSHFQNAWMLAQYLRTHTMINKNKIQASDVGGDLEYFDMDLFVPDTWAEYWITHHRSKRDEFTTEYGLRIAHDKHKKKQYDNDVSEVTGGSHVLKRSSRKSKKHASHTSTASKATRSPMKEKRHEPHEDESPPPSSDDSKVSSLPSIVRPRRVHHDSTDSDSDDSGGAIRKTEKKKRKEKGKEKDKKDKKSFRKYKEQKEKKEAKSKAVKRSKEKEQEEKRKSKPKRSSKKSYHSDTESDDPLPSDSSSSESSASESSSSSSSDSVSNAVYMNGIRKHEKKARKKKKPLPASSESKKESTPRITKRPVISSDLKWDNKRKNFPELKNRLEAHIIQAGMNYMIKPLFIRRYKKHGLQALNYYKSTLDISKPQFLHDLDVLYGYLKSAFRTGMALKHLRTYELTYDGIRVFDAIDQEFGLGGDKNVLIQHFEGIINEKNTIGIFRKVSLALWTILKMLLPSLEILKKLTRTERNFNS